MRDEPMSFAPNEFDVPVRRDGWKYWVRGVKRGQPLKADLGNSADSDLFDIVLDLLFGWLHRRWHARRTTYKVGVLAYPDSKWGGRFRVMHKETLAPGVEPAARIAELVRDVEAGRFHPVDRRRRR